MQHINNILNVLNELVDNGSADERYKLTVSNDDGLYTAAIECTNAAGLPLSPLFAPNGSGQALTCSSVDSLEDALFLLNLRCSQ